MSTLKLQPVTPGVGAEVSGADLSTPLQVSEVDAIRAALHDYGVLFFRGQDIGPEEQVAFAEQFGVISLPPIVNKHAGDPKFLILDQLSPKGEGADAWHSDNTFMAEPPLGSILKAVQLPAVGGDTCFASMFAAYQALSEPLRRLADSLEAEHDITKPLSRAIAKGLSSANLAELQEQWPPVRHPVVRTHPESGRKALYVNRNSTTKLLGVSEAENELLLPFLCDHVRSPEFQCRFRWDTHSIAFWDNRAVQHYAVPDYDERRVMHRVTLEGDRPY
jgi:taurine dioxygenase